MKKTIQEIFAGRKLVIATMHKKESVIGPILEKSLGVTIVVPQSFNSDMFGTFTKDIKRKGNQFQAAKRKLLAAMKQESLDLGVASEGSFGPHPSCPFVSGNFELILLIDLKNNYEIEGYFSTMDTNLGGKYIHNFQEALDFADKVGFPEHGVIVRKTENDIKNIYKDISNTDELKKIVENQLSKFFTKKIFIETDMRAHRNPTRMKAIETACHNLIKSVESVCPECHAPGYCISGVEKGLLCGHCLQATDLPLFNIYNCKKCSYTSKETNRDFPEYAEPEFCNYCNP